MISDRGSLSLLVRTGALAKSRRGIKSVQSVVSAAKSPASDSIVTVSVVARKDFIKNRSNPVNTLLLVWYTIYIIMKDAVVGSQVQHVLVIEDDSQIRRFLRTTLSAERYRLHEAA